MAQGGHRDPGAVEQGEFRLSLGDGSHRSFCGRALVLSTSWGEPQCSREDTLGALVSSGEVVA